MSNLQLLPHQYEFYDSFFCSPDDKYIAIVSGYGGGKSFTLAVISILFLSAFPGHTVAVYNVTFDLLKLIAIPQIISLLEQLRFKYTLNKADMIITVHGYGQIILRSLDNPGRIIGYESAIALADELATMQSDKGLDAFQRIMARNRQPIKGLLFTEGGLRFPNKIGVFTTPEGKTGVVYNKWVREKEEGFKLIRAKTTDNIFLPEDYVDNLRKNYPPQLIEAYLNGEFVHMTSGLVYYAFDPEKNHFDATEMIAEYIDDKTYNKVVGIDRAIIT